MAESHSVLEIEIACHYWAHVDDFREGRFTCGQREIMERMVERGLLQYARDSGRIFERGPALATYIDALGSVPWPRPSFAVDWPPEIVRHWSA